MAGGTPCDTGLKPFVPDENRGKWSSSMDFFCACLGHAFKVDAIFILTSLVFREIGIYALIPYFITLAMCAVPIMFVQSFLGQFSSTGFISAFRISPLFKGIGYVSLAMNLTTLTYYSVFTAIPLLYFFHTLQPTIPWSCEGAHEWMDVGANLTSVCTKNRTMRVVTGMIIPSLEFFKGHLNTMGVYDENYSEGMFSWSLLVCSFVIWSIAATIVLKPIETIGRFMRYSCLAIIGIMSLCVIRFLFLPGALVSLIKFVQPANFQINWVLVPIMAFATLGPGWGSILTMASYNDFKTNIHSHSWFLSLARVEIMMGLSLMSVFIINFMKTYDPENLHFDNIQIQWRDFLTIPTALTFLEVPHLWSLLFFGMLTLGGLSLMITELFSVLTSLFDEYVILRKLKEEVTVALVILLAVCSSLFCSFHGTTLLELLMKFSIVTQMCLNFLLLVVVLWVYGQERFQRDLKFMISHTSPVWMLDIARFVAPLFIVFGLVGFVYYCYDSYSEAGRIITVGAGYQPLTWLMFFIVLVIALLPWCLIPVYCVYKIKQTCGISGLHLKQTVRPTDWYPADPLDRHRYDEILSGNMRISHWQVTGMEELNCANLLK